MLANPNACLRPIKPIKKSIIIDGETGKELAGLQHGSQLLFAYSSIGDKKMIYEPAREGYIEDLDQYHTARDKALANVRAPPPTLDDIAQLKEAYADESPSYNWNHPEQNAKQRALAFWSDSLYTGDQLREVMPSIVTSYNKFSTAIIEELVKLLPGALWLPAREHSVALYQFGGRALTRNEQGALKIVEYHEVKSNVWRCW